MSISLKANTTAFQISQSSNLQKQVCFERVTNFSIFFPKTSTPRNWHPYPSSAMFMVIELVALEFWPSVTLHWWYFLLTTMIMMTRDQQWCAIGTLVEDMNASAIDRTVDISTRTVRSVLAGDTCRAKLKGVKEGPHKHLHQACVQQWPWRRVRHGIVVNFP